VTETTILKGAAAAGDPPLQIVCRYSGRCPGQRSIWRVDASNPIMASDFNCKWVAGPGVAQHVFPGKPDWWEGPPSSALALSGSDSRHVLTYTHAANGAPGPTWSAPTNVSGLGERPFLPLYPPARPPAHPPAPPPARPPSRLPSLPPARPPRPPAPRPPARPPARLRKRSRSTCQLPPHPPAALTSHPPSLPPPSRPLPAPIPPDLSFSLSRPPSGSPAMPPVMRPPATMPTPPRAPHPTAPHPIPPHRVQPAFGRLWLLSSFNGPRNRDDGQWHGDQR
jgi:hypothetical protein